METITIPTKQGQIRRFVAPLPDEDPMESYILVDQLYTDDCSEAVQIVSITHLQRNIHEPRSAPRSTVRKDDLTVIADDLESFVASFNK